MRVHYAVARANELSMLLGEQEAYINCYDVYVRAGCFTRRAWEDVRQVVERKLLSILLAVGDGAVLGTKTIPGIWQELNNEQGLSRGVIVRAIRELAPRFELRKFRMWFVVRVF